MLTKCANPNCREEFRSLRSGRLFVAEPKTHTRGATTATGRRGKLEYFWLCAACCKSMRVSVDHDHHVVVTSLYGPATAVPVSVNGSAVMIEGDTFPGLVGHPTVRP